MKNTSNTETRKGNLYLSNYSLLIFHLEILICIL